MLQMKSCTRNFEADENSSEFEKMLEDHEYCENFTNFSISEILKPDFGRKHLAAAGVLNLSSDKTINEQTDTTNTLQQFYNWASQATIANHFGLNISAFSPHMNVNITTTNSFARQHAHRDIENTSKNFGFSLISNNKHDAVTTKSTRRNTDSGGSSCESDDESVKSSNASSPAGSPSSSLVGNRQENVDGKLWPAWVYCTRYSDRPSAGPRSRKLRRKDKAEEEKRPRTAFSTDQLRKLKDEFEANKYLSESRRQQLSRELNLNESQIKIWFQNKRAKIKKGTGERNELALELIAQGLYNHKTVKFES